MQKAKTPGRVERERERATFLENKVAYISVALNYQEILNKIKLRNKDPCYICRLLYLRI